MNLIEQLGGYEKAKTIVEKAPCKTYTYHNHPYQKGYIRCWGGDGKEYFLVSDIEKALLEYRRQHNKYEVDDLVVFSNEKLMKPVLLKIKEFRHFNLVRLEVLDSGLCGPSYQTDIRHATDEEIEAGKRLEVV